MAEGTPVSWIDQDEVADLVRQLQGPAAPPAPGAWEIHTLPAETKEPGPAWSLMAEDASEPLQVQESASEEKINEEPAVVMPGFEPVAEVGTIFPAAASVGLEVALDDGSTSEIERIRHQLRMLRQHAEATGVVASSPTENAVEMQPSVSDEVSEDLPQLELPEAGLGNRLEAVCTWAQHGTRSDEAVVVGEFGDVISGASSHISLVLSELMAWQSSLREDPAQTLSAVRAVQRMMPDGRRMTLIPVRSSYGGVTLVLLGGDGISDAVAEMLANGLSVALDPVA
jgi:hypothetical protein